MRPGSATLAVLLALGGCAGAQPMAQPVAESPSEAEQTREFLALLGGWDVPVTADQCTGVRPESGAPPYSWPAEHGWLACGIAARAPLATPVQLVLRDARTREPLIGGELGAGQHGAFVLLLRVPTLDRALLLRLGSGSWEAVASADIPIRARDKGFDACPLAELRTGGWLEHGLSRIPSLRQEGPNGHSANLSLWSGNGKGTETIASWKDAKLRGEVPEGSSVLAEPTDVDAWFLQNPLADWPWPVWTLTAQLKSATAQVR